MVGFELDGVRLDAPELSRLPLMKVPFEDLTSYLEGELVIRPWC